MIISKNNYRLIVIDLGRQSNDPKAIQQIEFVGQLKSLDADDTKNMFVLTIWEKIKETRSKFSQGIVQQIVWKLHN